ncbi:MAG: KpsF/GutQ family sugar-phosphate isomerase [Bdellovibrionales bacterium]|nr:KpsF/GutQ family sugar-phosphate isomerase [Bdellovibrionales bacterium]
MSERLDHNFSEAVEVLYQCQGKVIVTGIGKSGHIGRKLASTLSSTGTPAVFLHPAESSHGDLGVIGSQDVVIGISYGGESPELSVVLSFLARKGIPLVAMTGRSQSQLAQGAKVVLDVSVSEEACPLGLAPTTSTTATLALGDALALALLKRRGFRAEDFAQFHPGGSLGRKLLLRVKDIMHQGEALPLVSPDESLGSLLSVMTSRETRGVAGVIDASEKLIGIVTDGDIRRNIQGGQFDLKETAQSLMSKNPKTIDCNELAQKALFLMEQFRINLLFAVDKTSSNPTRPVGVIHVQDLLTAKIQ